MFKLSLQIIFTVSIVKTFSMQIRTKILTVLVQVLVQSLQKHRECLFFKIMKLIRKSDIK